MNKEKETKQKSTFDNLKQSICDNIMACRTLRQVKSKLNEILEEWDLEDSEWEDEELIPTPEKLIFPDGHREEVTRCSPRWFEIVGDINSGKIKSEESNGFKEAKNSFSYPACCNKDLFKQLNYKLGHAGVGVVFESGYGDGCYEVWANVVDCGNLGKRIKEVKIKMITDREERLVEKIGMKKKKK